jgi:CheY-like chemotaxis protein
MSRKEKKEGPTMTKQANRFLIVDDEESIRDILSNTLEDAGYTAVAAASGEEALAIMREDPAWALFLDLKLPGMDGNELCRTIRKDWPMAIPYAVTGYTTLFELVACRDAGFEDYFLKPLDRKLILDTAAHTVNKLERWTRR